MPALERAGEAEGAETFETPSARQVGIPPDTMLASHITLGVVVDRTRPLCPYPSVARWSGRGSTDEAANFTCVESSQMRREKSSR